MLKPKDWRLRQREGCVSQMDERLARLVTQNRDLNLELSQLWDSWSWKFSAPIRMVGKIARRLKKASRIEALR
jgi:hypothetical protein